MEVGSRADYKDYGEFPVAASALTTTAPAGGYYARVRARNACGVGPASEEIAVAVGDVNIVPQANPDEATTSAGRGVRIAVTDNDIDPDADDLAVRVTAAPAHGDDSNCLESQAFSG